MKSRTTGEPIALSINLNKIALLRNSRGGQNPSLLVAAKKCALGGAAGLTLHWREDERHTQKQDVYDIKAFCEDANIEFNLEGDGRLEMIDLAMECRPTQFTLVPVTPGEITSDHGWDLPNETEFVRNIIKKINDRGIRTAIFMDADPDKMEEAQSTETQRVEIYTEPYAQAFETSNRENELKRLSDTIKKATECGLGVNAGHDLNLKNVPPLAQSCPGLLEVSIGHAFVADSLYLGMDKALESYLKACAGESVDAPRTC